MANGTKRACVLIANEPRVYREMLASALKGLRPDADIKLVEPDVLNLETERVVPDLVFCDEASETIRTMASAWVELYLAASQWR